MDNTQAISNWNPFHSTYAFFGSWFSMSPGWVVVSSSCSVSVLGLSRVSVTGPGGREERKALTLSVFMFATLVLFTATIWSLHLHVSIVVHRLNYKSIWALNKFYLPCTSEFHPKYINHIILLILQFIAMLPPLKIFLLYHSYILTWDFCISWLVSLAQYSWWPLQ